jgi:hypothetical protein
MMKYAATNYGAVKASLCRPLPLCLPVAGKAATYANDNRSAGNV